MRAVTWSGIVEEVGADVDELEVDDRVVIPFQISCGHRWMCDQQLYTQWETTQVRSEILRVPQAQFTHVKVPEGPPAERFVYVSDVL